MSRENTVLVIELMQNDDMKCEPNSPFKVKKEKSGHKKPLY